MGLVHAAVRLTNAREAVLARLGHLPAEQVHIYETEALVDTGAMRVVLPPFVADQLGLIRMGHTVAQYINGQSEEVDTTEPFLIDILGRQTVAMAMVVEQHVLLGVTVLEQLDLMVDPYRQRVIPNPAHPDQPVFQV
jgi:predicted aspartyl protease